MCTCPNLNHTYGCPAYKGTPSNLEEFNTDTPWELQDTEETPTDPPIKPGANFEPVALAAGLALLFVGAYLLLFPVC